MTRRLLALGLAGALCLVSPLAAGTEGPDLVALDAEPQPHLACERNLREIASLRKAGEKILEEGDLAEFKKLHEQIEVHLQIARRHMERALLVGAWKEKAAKAKGFDLTWRLESAEMLNFVPQAWAEGYKHPTGKPSASMKDATRRLFNEVDHLIARVAEVNGKLASPVAAAAGKSTPGKKP